MGDLLKLLQRLGILENFISDNQDGNSSNGTFIDRRKIACALVDNILSDVKKNAHAVSESLKTPISITEGLTREVQYIRAYITRLVRWTQSSIKVVNSLHQLIQALTWAERNVLSPLIIPTSFLVDIMSYIDTHLEQNTMLS